MATTAKPQLTPQDYIGHRFHPDCDFVDGWVINSVTRAAFDWSNGDWEPTTDFFVKNSPIRLSIADLTLPKVTKDIPKLN
jgi:hypothetical protein